MNVARLAKIAGVCLGIFAVTGVADCQLAPAPKAGPAGAPPPISGYAAAREAMMKPAMEAMARRNYAASLDLFHVVLEEYPNDARALMLTANAAWAAGKWEEAADRYGEIVRQGVHYIWRDQLTLIRLDAGLGAMGRPGAAGFGAAGDGEAWQSADGVSEGWVCGGGVRPGDAAGARD